MEPRPTENNQDNTAASDEPKPSEPTTAPPVTDMPAPKDDVPPPDTPAVTPSAQTQQAQPHEVDSASSAGYNSPPTREYTAPIAPSARNGRRKPTLAIVAAVIVALLLAIAAFLAYIKAKDPTAPAPNVSTTDSATPAQAVDQTTQTIDQTISDLGDTPPFAEEDLSDASLGL
jgi:hypothetical protein